MSILSGLMLFIVSAIAGGMAVLIAVRLFHRIMCLFFGTSICPHPGD